MDKETLKGLEELRKSLNPLNKFLHQYGVRIDLSFHEKTNILMYNPIIFYKINKN